MPIDVLKILNFISEQTFKNHVIQSVKQNPKQDLGVQQVKRIGLTLTIKMGKTANIKISK